MNEDDIEQAHFMHCFKMYAPLVEALSKATRELNAIRARDGAPQHISWDRGRPMQTDSCSHEYWDELTNECMDVLEKAKSGYPALKAVNAEAEDAYKLLNDFGVPNIGARGCFLSLRERIGVVLAERDEYKRRSSTEVGTPIGNLTKAKGITA